MIRVGACQIDLSAEKACYISFKGRESAAVIRGSKPLDVCWIHRYVRLLAITPDTAFYFRLDHDDFGRMGPKLRT